MTMATFLTSILIAGIYSSYCGLDVANAESFPEERGIIMTTFSKDPNASQLYHLPAYPGYENITGPVPSFRLTNQDSHFMSVDVDYAASSIYVYDYYLRSIIIIEGYNKDLNMRKMNLSSMHVGISKGTVKVAVDWLSHTVYWTDAVFRWIIAAPGQMEKVERDYFKIIVDDHLDAPQGVTLDPIDGYLFWTDNGKHPKIERSDLMGSNRHTIITSTDSMLSFPLSIEADIFEKRIYWLDAREEEVMTAKYDGSDIIMIRRLMNTQLMDLAIFRDCLIVTDIKHGAMYTLNKTRGPRIGMLESSIIKDLFHETIQGIAVYSPETQPVGETDVCAEKSCEQMCISTKTGAKCVCAEGYKMNNTGLCIEVYHKAVVYANATHICFTDIRVFAYNMYDAFCIFTVLKQPASADTPASVPSESGQDTSQTDTAAPIPTTRHINVSTTASADVMITMFDMYMENRILYFASVDTIYEREIDLPITNNVTVVIVRASGTISGLAYDAGDTNNLYWCESDTGVVKVVNVATRSPKLISPQNKTLINPRNLIVLLNTRKLAWISGTTNSSIQTMTMNGEDIKVVYERDTNISSLIADEHVQLFYFLSQEKVYSVMFDGSALKEVTTLESTAYKLLLYNRYLAWIYTTPKHNNLMKAIRVDTGTVNGHGYLDEVAKIVDIKVLDMRLQSTNISRPCAYMNGNCSQICITVYKDDIMTKVCACKMGYTLDKDQSSCKTVSICLDISLSHGHVTAACGKQIGEACLYQCDHDYTNVTYKTVCTNDLRWHPLDACTNQKHTDDETWEAVLIIGIIVLILVIIAAVSVPVFFLSRNVTKKSSTKYKIASFRRHDDIIAITNVKFEEMVLPVNDPKDYQMLFSKEGAAGGEDGVLNSAYNQDPLSAATSFEVTHDRTILTYEAWLKEREKWKKMDKL